MKASHKTLYLMGTLISLSIYHEQAQDVLEQAITLLHTYNQRFSANDDTSELMAINRAAGSKPLLVHPQLYQLIDIGKKYSLAKESQLNIAIGPLIKAWRIGFQDATVPSQEVIDNCLTLCQPENIILDKQKQTVFLKDKGMALDLGALAKGYITDLLHDFFKREGVRSGVINLGGNVLTFGPAPHHKDGLWRIGIRLPHKNSSQNALILKIRDKALVTSGTYERRLIQHGKGYHHILDRQTGYPIETDITSLSIIAKTALEGEIWSSRLFGQTVDDVFKQISKIKYTDALVISHNHHCQLSPNLERQLIYKHPSISFPQENLNPKIPLSF